MNKKKILIILTASVATVAIVLASVMVNAKLDSQQATIQELTNSNTKLSKEVDELSKDINQLNTDNSELAKERDSLKKLIDKMSQEVGFNPDNLRQLSNTTEYQMRKALKGTKLYSLAPSFVKLESKYHINAYFLVALTAHESSWGNSDRSKFQNNLTGYQVYSRGSAGATFSDKHSGLDKTAELLSDQYLSPKGKHFNGYSTYDVNTEYCRTEDDSAPDRGWYVSINDIAYQLVNKANKK